MSVKTKQKISPLTLKKFRRHSRIGEILYKNSWALNLVKRINSTTSSFIDDYSKHLSYERYITNSELGTSEQAGYKGQDMPDFHAAKGILSTAEILNHPEKEFFDSEIPSLVSDQEAICTQVMSHEEDSRFVNFGVHYAYLDAILARSFPGWSFYGVDFSKFTKLINSMEFGGIENLHIEECDIFDFLRRQRGDGGIFFHSRTLILMPISFIESLYKAVFDAGFEKIMGFEQIGISKETEDVFEFDSEKKKSSVHLRANLFIHNYPGLVERYGFRVKDMKILDTN